MSLVILGDLFTFPDGTAATNRVHTYAKGFFENNINVHVICFGNEFFAGDDGVINGINFYHPFGQSKRNRYFLVRRWLNFYKYLKTIGLLCRINRKDKILALNCVTDRLLATQLFVFLLSKYFGFKMILERSEHPLQNYQGSSFKMTMGNFRARFEPKLCDGIFCISQYLIDFYKARGLASNKMFLVPSTVDTERFQISCNPPLSYQYILYCGSLTIYKDGVNILIESFARIHGKYPEIKLVLIGKGDFQHEELSLKELVISLNITDKVIFLGQLPRTEIPAYLINARILALARPKSIVASAGFPSKLTEYLATGNPIVVTKVGEIPSFLKDNVNAILSEPDSVDAFADKLDFALGNYEESKKIGARGKELTMTIFNYNFQAKRMIEFIASLN